MDAVAARLAAVDARIAAISDQQLPRSDATGPMDAWRAAWLALASLTARIQQSRQAATARIAMLPADEYVRARELTVELEAVAAALAAAGSARADDLAEAGRSLATRLTITRPPVPKAHATTAPDPPRAVAIKAPPSRLRPIGVVNGPREASAPVIVGSRPTTAVPKTSVSSITRPTSGSSRVDRRAEPPAHEVAARAGPIPHRPLSTAPAAAAENIEARPWGRLAVAIVSVLILTAGVAVATRWNELGIGQAGLLATSGPREIGESSPSAKASRASRARSSPAVLSRAVTFDLLPLGPLTASAAPTPISRIIGAPEVAPVPTAFDRSLQLGTGSGICLSDPAVTARRRVEFSLRGDGAVSGRIELGLGEGSAVALDLAGLDASGQDEWHALSIGADGSASGPSGTVGLPPVPDSLASATSPGEGCLAAVLDATDASVFIDNLGLSP